MEKSGCFSSAWKGLPATLQNLCVKRHIWRFGIGKLAPHPYFCSLKMGNGLFQAFFFKTSS
jgi:hypothetical protein